MLGGRTRAEKLRQVMVLLFEEVVASHWHFWPFWRGGGGVYCMIAEDEEGKQPCILLHVCLLGVVRTFQICLITVASSWR